MSLPSAAVVRGAAAQTPVFGLTCAAPVEALAVTADARWCVAGLGDGTVVRLGLFESFRGEGGSVPITSPLRCWTDHGGKQLALWPTHAVPPTSGVVSNLHQSYAVSAIALHSEGVWCLTGHSSGRMGLWSVRLQEGDPIWSEAIHEVCMSYGLTFFFFGGWVFFQR